MHAALFGILVLMGAFEEPVRTCQLCSGRGYTLCKNCDTNRKVLGVCPRCAGSKTEKCERCKGTASVTCPNCKGVGRRPVEVYTPGKNGTRSVQKVNCPRTVKCGRCTNGSYKCLKCNGKGTFPSETCNICDRQRKISCQECAITKSFDAKANLIELPVDALLKDAKADLLTALQKDVRWRQSSRKLAPFFAEVIDVKVGPDHSKDVDRNIEQIDGESEDGASTDPPPEQKTSAENKDAANPSRVACFTLRFHTPTRATSFTENAFVHSVRLEWASTINKGDLVPALVPVGEEVGKFQFDDAILAGEPLPSKYATMAGPKADPKAANAAKKAVKGSSEPRQTAVH